MRQAVLFSFSVSLLVFFAGACAHSSKKEQVQSQNYFELGQSLLLEGDLPGSLSALEKARELNPDKADIHLVLGVAYMRSSYYPQSEASFRKALELDPQFTEVWNNLAALELKRKQPEKAIEYANKALKEPTYATPEMALANRARAYIQKNQYKKARQSVDEALSRNPNACQVHLLKSKILNHSAEYEKAFEQTQMAEAICESSPSVALWVAYSLYLNGRRSAAEKKYQSIIKKYKVGTEVEQSQEAIRMLRDKVPLHEPLEW